MRVWCLNHGHLGLSRHRRDGGSSRLAALEEGHNGQSSAAGPQEESEPCKCTRSTEFVARAIAIEVEVADNVRQACSSCNPENPPHHVEDELNKRNSGAVPDANYIKDDEDQAENHGGDTGEELHDRNSEI